MSWGYKILSAYIIFILGISYLVFRTTGERHDLVTPDYYEQELAYQQRIDEIKRTNNLSQPVLCSIQERNIMVEFPPELQQKKMNVDAVLYCITNMKQDTEKSWLVSDGKLVWPLLPGYHGTFILKLHFNHEKESYYFEKKLFIK